MGLKAVNVLAVAILASSVTAFSACDSERTVPDVRYEDLETAYELLHYVGFKVTVTCSSGRPAAAAPYSAWPAAVPLAAPSPLSDCTIDLTGPVVVTEPHLGRSLRTGSTVVIGVRPPSICGLGRSSCIYTDSGEVRIDTPQSPEISPRRQPSLMPDLVGETLTSAKRRIGCLSLSVSLLPLRAGDRPHLLDNYVVTRQSPAKGEFVGPSASNPPCSPWRPITLKVELAR